MSAPKSGVKTKAYLSVGTYIVMNLVCMVSLRSLAVEADYGISSAFYYLFAAIFFLIPISFVGAELSTGGWKQIGGIFGWVSEAFGQGAGLLSLFLMLMSSTIFMPTALIFASTCLAHILPDSIGANLSQNRIYTLVVVLVVFWAAMFIALRGLSKASKISSIGGIIGTIIPIVLLFIFTGAYVLLGNHMEFTDVPQHFFPDLSNTNNLVLAGSVFLFYAGMELNAVHVNELKNPKRDYPLTVFSVAIISVIIFVFGTLCIASLIPHGHIDIVEALIICFKRVFAYFHVAWLLPVIAIFMVIGVFAQAIVLLSGPSKGVYHIAKLGYLPPRFQKTNKNGVQQPILLFQGLIVTILAFFLLLFPSVQSAFQLISQLSVIAVLVKYILLFASGIWLRFKRPDTPRGYRVPGGKIGMPIVGGLGIIACVWAFFVNFHIPSQFAVGSATTYIACLVIGLVVIVGIPLCFYAFHKPSWRETPESKAFLEEMGIDPKDLP